MSKDITIKNDYNLSNIDFSNMLTRLGNDLPTLSTKALKKIESRMPEINRASKAFGRRNSAVENKLMSLSIISHSPYKRLKQCLAQIEKSRSALKEAYFSAAKDQNQLNKLQHKLKNEDLDEFEKTDIEIEIAEIKTKLADSKIYVEGALKSIADFQDAYEQIKKTYNIPDKWDEKDFVEAEYEHHIKTAYTQAIRDLQMTGRLNVGNSEYFEQYGINPVVAVAETHSYLSSLTPQSTIDDLYRFLDEMYNKHRDDPKKAMKRIGLQSIYDEDFLYIENKKGNK